MQGCSENWCLPSQPFKIKHKFLNGITIQNLFSFFNDEKYFNTEIDAKPDKEEIIRTEKKIKTWTKSHDDSKVEVSSLLDF